MRIAMAPDARQAPEALEAVFREYAPLIYRTARTITRSPEDAEDIVQTIFLRLLRGEYTANLQGNSRGYLHQAAVNLSLDVLRRRQRRTFIHDVDDCAPGVRPARAWLADGRLVIPFHRTSTAVGVEAGTCERPRRSPGHRACREAFGELT
jgi:RNA polymerase sigma factor (sigma-70 family)